MDMSTAILTLSENGQLQKIHDKWLDTRSCGQKNSHDSDQLQLKSFWGLFLICGITCFVALLIYFCLIYSKFKRYFPQLSEPSTQDSSPSIRIRRFLSFVDEKEEELKNRLKRKSMEMLLRGSAEDRQSPNGVSREASGTYREGHNGNAYLH